MAPKLPVVFHYWIVPNSRGFSVDFDFMGAILPRTTAGNAVAERPQSAGIR